MTSIIVKAEPRPWENFHPECRLCMSQESLNDVFEEECFLHWILDYLSIAVSRDDGISQSICTVCRIQLAEFHRFRIRCQDVQSVLQSTYLTGSFGAETEVDTVVVKSEPKAWRNFHPVCRLCMSEETLDSIFNEEGLHQLILDYLKIVVSHEDHISQVICAICRLQLTEFHQFRIRCQDVQNVLLSTMVDEGDGSEQGEPISSLKMECEPSCGLELDEESEHVGLTQENCDRLEQNRNNLSKQESNKSLVTKPMPIEHVNIKTETTEEDISRSDPHEHETEPTSAMVQIPLDIIQKHETATPTTKSQNDCVDTTQPNEIQHDEIVIEDVKVEPPEKEDAPKVEVPGYPCNLCDRVCTSRNKLKRHKQIVHGPRIHACELCNYTATLHRDLRKHLQTRQHFLKVHASLGNDAFAVPVNSKQENDGNQSVNDNKVKVEIDRPNGTEAVSPEVKNAAGDHPLQTTEANNVEQQLQCDICHKTFAMDKKQLMDHKWYVHGFNKYECPICGRPFALRIRMQYHLRTHEGPRHRGKRKDLEHLAKPFKCEICARAFRLKKSYEYHRRLKHGLTEFVCQVCDKPFAYPYQLKEHMDLNDHSHVVRRRQVVRRPTTEDDDVDIRYKCNICQKTFRLEGSLYTHRKMKHEEKPHVCSICDKSYAFQSQLSLHMKSHENPKRRIRRAKVAVPRIEGDGPMTRARSSRSQPTECVQAEGGAFIE